MGPRLLACVGLVLALLSGSCARPVYQSAAAPAAEAAPARVAEQPPIAEAAKPPEAPAAIAASPAAAALTAPAATAAAVKADLFTTSIRPILASHCAPCHEPGGKMYDRLPFDKPETLATHQPGVLKRLKGDDRAAFEAWVKTLP